MDIRKVPISKVVPWDKNPRTAEPEDLARLKAQVEKLGVYKPLVAYKDGEQYVVIGGNMRLTSLPGAGAQGGRGLGRQGQDRGRQDRDLHLRQRPGRLLRPRRALAELLYEHKDGSRQGIFKVDLGVDEGLATASGDLGRPYRAD